MKCPTTASALILVSLASSALEACAAPVQNIPSIPSTPKTPNPVSFFSFLPRDEHIKSPRALDIDSSEFISPQARHLHNEEDSEPSPVEPVEEASQQDSTDVNNPSTTSIPHRSSRKSSGRTKPEGSLAQNPRKSSRPNRHRSKTTDDPQTDTSSKRSKRPVQNSPTNEEVNDVHDLDPAQRTGQSSNPKHRSKLSTKPDNGTPTADEALTEGPPKNPSSSARKKTEKSQKKPKPKPPSSPPSRKSNTDGYFYAQGLTASFNSASSANAATANAFAVNGGNSAGNVVGMPRPPGM
ncbi:hypothetical protein GGU10DRAFT_368882 [Lentinula aff. detonsa]|uniref:Uncharacterized protein n=1 Tax=Lentinula aff. detonsa TaxID=2804958 RepID=A0AA38KDF4_9AGAR|nr:hypothetical protein GGU10DRAFT_368882 [Lentinula aff. detonsa]